ncbi:hypothetical protein OG21DRAFT_1489822 [Imleria badia]|nr:hypothetical protein OG21DRAFT_1489822 [Imleria badia]
MLLALQHCPHPPNLGSDLDGLKPDNTFLNDIDSVKGASTGEPRQHFCRNGRIPPLPRDYSQTLSSVFKAMVNLNPAMTPSAAQLLQHELLALITKVIDAEKKYSTVKTHQSAVIPKEREISARETALAEREAKLATVDAGTLRVYNFLSTAQSQLDARIREAVGKREEELCVAIRKREEVAAGMARREDEICGIASKRSSTHGGRFGGGAEQTG